MSEIMARVAPNGRVEIVDDKGKKIEATGALLPNDAAFLARGILACAAALSAANPPEAGRLVGDAHLPITKWVVGASNANGEPVLVLSIPSGIELTFQIPAQAAKEIAAALVTQADKSGPPIDKAKVH